MMAAATAMANGVTTIEAPSIRTVLVDDHPLFRLGLRTLLTKDPALVVVAEVGTPAQVLEIANQLRFDVAIVDVLLPGTSGVEMTSELRRIQPGCQVLALSMLDDPHRIAEMLRAGAAGFAHKSQSADEIIGAIKQVASGKRYLPPAVSHDLIDNLLTDAAAWPLDRLSPREREVFELLVAGHTSESIGNRLFISRRTVEAHRQHITRKLGVHTMIDLVRIAVHAGVVGL